MNARRLRILLMLLLALLPALGCATLISHYGVNVPFWDEWEVGPALFEKMAAGQLTGSDLFKFHNEHRIVTYRLLILATAPFTHMNTKALMWISFAFAGLTALGIYALARRSPLNYRWITLLFLLANLTLFSAVQHENWLWGMQTLFFIPTLCLVWALWLALSPWPRWLVYPLAILLGLLATFSSANGMLLWVIVALPLAWSASRRELAEKKSWLLAWTATFLASTIFYFQGYHSPPDHPPLSYALTHPLQSVHYFLTYLGGSLGFGTLVPPTLWCAAIGAALLAAYLFMTAYMVWQRRDYAFLKPLLAWWGLGLYALGCAGMTTLGRVGMGVEQGLSSRYTTFSQWLLIALLFGLPLILLDARKKGFLLTRALGPALAIGLGAFLVTWTLTNAWAIERCAVTRNHRLAARARMLLLHLIPEEGVSNYLFYKVPLTAPYARCLDQLGYMQPPLIRTRNITELRGSDEQANQLGLQGKIEQMVQVSPGHYLVTGWAAFTKLDRTVDTIMLTYESPTTPPTLLGLADVALDHQPVPAAQNAGRNIGWRRGSAYPASLPPGSWLLRAWAIDSSTGKFYPLQGTVPFIR